MTYTCARRILIQDVNRNRLVIFLSCQTRMVDTNTPTENPDDKTLSHLGSGSTVERQTRTLTRLLVGERRLRELATGNRA